MELLILYRFISPFGNPLYAEYFGYNKADSWLLWLLAVAAYAVICVFKAIGLYTMAKKQGKSKLLCLCACVPFASTFLMGEVSGSLRLGNAKIKHIGLFAMIAEIILCAGYAVQDIPQSIIFMDENLYRIIPEQQGNNVVLTLQFTTAVPQALVYAMNFCNIFSSIFYFIWLVAFVFLCMNFFRAYAPATYIWMVILCAFIPAVTGFFAFAFRTRKPVDYDKFMQARMEQIRRAQQAQYGPYGPYGQNPYGGNPYNPYGQNPYGSPYGPANGQGAPKQPDDPFGEYTAGRSSSAAGEGDSASNGGSAAQNGAGNAPSDDPFGEFANGGDSDKKE